MVSFGPATAGLGRHVYDYEGFSRLAGPFGEAPAKARYRVGVRPLRRAHPRRAVIFTAGSVLAQGAFIAWLLLHGVADPFADRSVWLAMVSVFMVVAILAIELFRFVKS